MARPSRIRKAALLRRLRRGGWARPLLVAGTLAALTIAVISLISPYPAEPLSYDRQRSARILDRHGVLLYERRGETGGYSRPVALSEVSEWVITVTLSGEDAGFYHHEGIDPAGVGRALWLNAREGRLAYGGSTITQQLAKLLDPGQPRTLSTKAAEAYDALRLERTLSKEQILEQYLNRAYYGRQAYGIEAAAQRFMGKPAKELSLSEGALLAILPRAPSAYDPERHPDVARRRRAHVLEHLAGRGWISQPQAEAAAAAPIVLVDPRQERRAPHLLDYLDSHQLLPAGAAQVRLTIDIGLQEQLERQARLHLNEIAHRRVSQAAIVVLDNATGDVLAMVGSRRYGEASVAGAVNATVALRPPGSTLKPFVYALAVEDGAQPSSLVLDVPTHWRGYQPRSHTEQYHGAVPLREALGSSLNVPAVRAAARLGPERVARLLHEVGLQSVDPDRSHGAGIALGAVSVPLVELADAYATLARQGLYLPHRLLLEAPATEPRRVLAADSAFLITQVLADPVARRREFGLETPLELPFPAAAKTGTSQAFGDNVVVGFSSSVTVAVWVGNFDGEPMHGLLAMQGAAPLWRDAMLLSHRGRETRDFAPPPKGIVAAEVCLDTGLRAGKSCPRRRTELLATRHLPAIHISEHHEAAPELLAEAIETLPGRTDRPPLEILGPPRGATFVVDPLLPPERQRLELRAAVRLPARVETVRWLLDGRPIAEVGAPFRAHWTITPGRHVLRLEAVGEPLLADEIDFTVDGEST